MTTVYGVTFIGAREQIEKQLKDRKDLPEEECWPAAAYLAKKVRRVYLFKIIIHQMLYRLSDALPICSVVQKASRRGSTSAHALLPSRFQVTGLQKPWKLSREARPSVLITNPCLPLD